MKGPQDDRLTQCVRVLAKGRVQGVGFRDSCVQRARAQGIEGWVRNRVDGSVEALLQGMPEALDAMCDWMRHRVPGARVDTLQVEAVAPPFERIHGFGRRPTA